MLCNFTIHYTKNLLTWANLQPRAIRFELLNQTHFSHKIYFVNTIHVNNKTLGLMFTATIQHRFYFVKPEIHGHFWPYTHRSIIYSTICTLATPKQFVDCTDYPNELKECPTIRSQVLGPIKRPFKASNHPNHQPKHLNRK